MSNQLAKATFEGDLKKVKFFVEKRMNPDCRQPGPWNAFGSTPLIIASRKNRREIAKVLIEAGADVNLSDCSQRDDIFDAATNGETSPIPAGINGETPLIEASRYGHVEMVSLLLNADADINGRDTFNQTALMIASMFGQIEVVKLLLTSGARVNKRTRDCRDSALMYATAGGHIEIVKLLIAAGAKVNVTNKSGYTPLTNALNWKNIDMVNVLLDAGATATKEQLMYAIVCNKDFSSNILLKMGVWVEMDEMFEFAKEHWYLYEICHKLPK